MVFRPGPVAGPVQKSDFRFWPRHLVVRVKFFLKKNQNDIVLVKKNNSQRVATGSTRRVSQANPQDHTGFFLSLFFFQLSPVSAPNLKSTRQPGFKIML